MGVLVPVEKQKQKTSHNNNTPPHDNAIFHAMSDLPTPKKGVIIPRMTMQEMLDIGR